MIASSTLSHLLSTYGYAAVFLAVMIESLGIPVPGETMLIAAALYAGAAHHLAIGYVVAAAVGGAVLGDNIGFLVGRRGGYPLLRRYGDKVRLDEGKLKLGRYLFDRHGGKIVFYGRFVSVLRTYAAFLAGVNRMAWPRFLSYNAAGGIAWSCLWGFGAWALGSAVHRLSGPVDAGIGVAAAALVAHGVWYVRRHGRELQQRAEDAYPGRLDEHDRAGATPG